MDSVGPNGLKSLKGHERERRIQSEQSFLGSFDADDDMGHTGMTDPNILAPVSRLADLSETVILAQLKDQ